MSGAGRAAALTEREEVEHRLLAEAHVRVVLRGLGADLAAVDLQVLDEELRLPELVEGRGEPEALEVQGAEGDRLHEPQDLGDEPEDQPDEDNLQSPTRRGMGPGIASRARV